MKKRIIQQAQYVVDLAHLIEEYDAQKLLLKLQARNLRKETGLWFDESNGVLVGTNFFALPGDGKHQSHEWTYRQIKPADLVKKVKASLKKTYGSKWADELKVFQATESLFTSKFFKKTAPGQYHVSGGYYGSILGYVLDYVVNGILSEDYARTQEAWKTTSRYGGYANALSVVGTHTSGNFPGMTVKVYANGRIDIKGMTPEQEERLENLYALALKIARTQPKYM